jgi:hypothetical protein
MERPVCGPCGSYIRLEWLKDELYKHLSDCLNEVEKKELVGWYMSYGYSMGFAKDVLINMLKADEELFNVSKILSDEEILRGRKPPKLRLGDEVEVVVNARNITYHRGYIFKMMWHGEEKEWFYHISEDGKKIGKRYYEKDLIVLNNNSNIGKVERNCT